MSPVAARFRGEVLLRVGVAAALAVDAVVHIALAPRMEIAAPGGIGGGLLFQAQAGAAIVVAVVLLVRPSRLTYALAGLVLLSALAAVLLYALVNVPALGPIPSMYDPQWYPLKVFTAVAEAAGLLLAGVGYVLCSRPAIS